MKKLSLILCSLSVSAATALTLSACNKAGGSLANAATPPPPNTRITAAHLVQIKPGMQRADAEKILGCQASMEDVKDVLMLKRSVATYVENKAMVEVVYKDNAVQELHPYLDGYTPPAISAADTTMPSMTGALGTEPSPAPGTNAAGEPNATAGSTPAALTGTSSASSVTATPTVAPR